MESKLWDTNLLRTTHQVALRSKNPFAHNFCCFLNDVRDTMVREQCNKRKCRRCKKRETIPQKWGVHSQHEPWQQPQDPYTSWSTDTFPHPLTSAHPCKPWTLWRNSHLTKDTKLTELKSTWHSLLTSDLSPCTASPFPQQPCHSTMTRHSGSCNRSTLSHQPILSTSHMPPPGTRLSQASKSQLPKQGQGHYHSLIWRKNNEEEGRTDHCGASSQSSLGSMVEVIHGHSAHERKLHVGVGVNATWWQKTEIYDLLMDLSVSWLVPNVREQEEPCGDYNVE